MKNGKYAKPLIEWTSQELREEIGKLTTTLEKTIAKNKRRRKALKDMNRSILISGASCARLLRNNMNLATRTANAEAQRTVLEKVLADQTKELTAMATYAHGLEMQQLTKTGPYKDERPGFWSRLLGRGGAPVKGA